MTSTMNTKLNRLIALLAVVLLYGCGKAAVSSAAVLTRDARRFRTYFPTVELISPETD